MLRSQLQYTYNVNHNHLAPLISIIASELNHEINYIPPTYVYYKMHLLLSVTSFTNNEWHDMRVVWRTNKNASWSIIIIRSELSAISDHCRSIRLNAVKHSKVTATYTRRSMGIIFVNTYLEQPRKLERFVLWCCKSYECVKEFPYKWPGIKMEPNDAHKIVFVWWFNCLSSPMVI